MAKNKSLKKTLILSCLTLVLCGVIVASATFALFSNTASNEGEITAAYMDIRLEMWDETKNDWVNAEGQVLNFVTSDNREEILWEPNATYQLPKLRVVNVGGIAVRFLLKLNFVSDNQNAPDVETIDLLDVIEFTTTVSGAPTDLESWNNTYLPKFGTKDGNVLFSWILAPFEQEPLETGYTYISPAFTVQGHMKYDVGNEYKGMVLGGISISAEAAQSNYMFESLINNEFAAN